MHRSGVIRVDRFKPWLARPLGKFPGVALMIALMGIAVAHPAKRGTAATPA
ncbi:MAG: hypothetical protein WA252_00735 [Candidatus Sulfotelmatobacter sp.]